MANKQKKKSKGAQVKVKIKGSARQVRTALQHLAKGKSDKGFGDL
jgi:hypothetical protein